MTKDDRLFNDDPIQPAPPAQRGALDKTLYHSCIHSCHCEFCLSPTAAVMVCRLTGKDCVHYPNPSAPCSNYEEDYTKHLGPFA